MHQYVYGSQVGLNHLERREQVMLAVCSLLVSCETCFVREVLGGLQGGIEGSKHNEVKE